MKTKKVMLTLDIELIEKLKNQGKERGIACVGSYIRQLLIELTKNPPACDG